MTDTHTVHRHEIPVDDQWHRIDFTGGVMHTDCRRPETVDVWVDHRPAAEVLQREFRAFGTGHPIPDDAYWVGTALSPAAEPLMARGALVWHVYARVAR